MARFLLFASAAVAVAACAAPVAAQPDGPVMAGSVDGQGYAAASAAYGRSTDEQSSVQSSSYRSFDYRGYEARYFASMRERAHMHHTVDAAGYLSWEGKVDDLGPGGEGVAPPQQAAGGVAVPATGCPSAGAGERVLGCRYIPLASPPQAGPGCPMGAGVRVLSCQYIPFAPPEVERPLAIANEDFAYENSVGPVMMSGSGGGGATVFSNSSSSASAFVSASASASASISIHGGGHGHGWGHMGGGCGCTHRSK